MLRYTLLGPDQHTPGYSYICGFAAVSGTAPADAAQVQLGSPPAFSLTRTPSGWDFATTSQESMLYPSHCGYSGSIKR